MLGLGISLLKGAVITALNYITENLKLFFDFSDKSPEFLFDGGTHFELSEYITVSDSDNDLDISGDLTITAWVKPEVGSNNAFFIDKSDPSSTNSRNYSFYIRATSSYLRFSSAPGNSAAVHIDSTTALTDGEWYHVAISIDGSATNGAKLYVNGVKEAEATRSSGSNPIVGTTSDLLFGKRSDGSLNYKGRMSSVGIWNRALSASEIESIKWKGKYSELSGTELTNLRGWWDLQGDVDDKSGNSNNGTNSSATLISNSYSAESPFKPRIKDVATPSSTDPLNFGEVYSGRAVNFDGVNDYVLANSFTMSGNQATFSFWANLDTIATGEFLLDTTNNGAQRFIVGFSDDSGTVKLAVYRSEAPNAGWKFFGTVTTGEWHHIAIVLNNTTATAYVDGVQSGSDQTITAIYLNGSNNTTIGANYAESGSFIDGKVSNVKILNTNISEAQVQELYTNPEQILPTGVSASNLKLNLPMQEGSGSYVYDGSGNGNHGTITGATWATPAQYGYQSSLVRSNTPMIFDYVNDYVDCGTLSDAFKNVANMSVSVWVNPQHSADGGVDYHSIVNQWDHSAGTMSWGLWLKAPDGSTDAHIHWNDGIAVEDGSATVSVNEWSHIAVTKSGGTVKLYHNGSEVHSGTGSSTTGNHSVDLLIGTQAKSSATAFFNGLINEVALWNTTLDADAVTALYNSGVPLLPTSDSGNYDNSSALQGYWRNDGNVTWTDRSTNSNHGTASGSPVSIVIPEGTTSGKDNQGFLLSHTHENSLRVYGSEYVSIEDSEVLSFGDGTDDTPFSLEAWIKMDDSAHFKIFSKGIYNSTFEYELKTEADSKCYTNLYGGTNIYQIAYTSSDLTAYVGQWIHVCSTYDGRATDDARSGIKIYINGSSQSLTLVKSGTYVAMNDLGANVHIGRYNTDYAKGLISQPRIYSKELSASEVLNNYNYGQALHQ